MGGQGQTRGAHLAGLARTVASLRQRVSLEKVGDAPRSVHVGGRCTEGADALAGPAMAFAFGGAQLDPDAAAAVRPSLARYGSVFIRLCRAGGAGVELRPVLDGVGSRHRSEEHTSEL